MKSDDEIKQPLFVFIFLMNKVPHIPVLWSSLRGLRADEGIQPATLQLLRTTWTNALFRAGSSLCVHVLKSTRLLSKTDQSQSQVSLCPLLTLMNRDQDGWMDGWKEGKGGQIKREEIERGMNEWLKVQGDPERIDGCRGCTEYVRWKLDGWKGGWMASTFP